MKASLLTAIGQTYDGLGLYPEALAAMEQSYSIRRDILGAEHSETLAALPDLIGAYNTNCQEDDAVKIGDEGLQLAQRILGPEHPTTVGIMISVTYNHMWDDDLDGAVKYCEEALRLSRKVLGPHHGTTLTLLANISYLYEMRMHQLEKAVKLREEGLAISRGHFIMQLAEGYHASGRYAEALKLFEENLEGKREYLGPEHYWTLLAAAAVGKLYVQMGQLERGVRLLDETWQLSSKLRNPRDDRPTKLRNSTARAYIMAGRVDRALNLLETPLESKPHRTTVVVQAQAQLSMGDYDGAVRLFEEALPSYPDPADPTDLAPPGNLAVAYALAGHHEEAIRLARDTMERIRDAHGEQHPDTALYMSDLGTVLCQASQFAEAVKWLESAVPILKEKVGPEGYYTLASMYQLAVAYHGVGRLEDAIALHVETLALSRKALGPEHPQTLASMILLGGAYSEQACYADAEPLLLAAHEGYSKRDAAFPTPYDHAQAREACTQLVQLYEKSNQPEKAAAWKEKQP